jgi:RimJ/RimL family protein N-acetyltransferase
MKIELGQIEKNDIPLMRDILNRDFTKFFNLHSAFNCTDLNMVYDELGADSSAYFFSIKTVQSGEFAKSIAGFCAITNIDWVARHGQLFFIMSDKHGRHLTINKFAESFNAFRLLLNYCFGELNLNKVWLDIPQGLDLREPLEKLGFVAEGVREYSRMIDGVQVSSTVFSLLTDERGEV